VEGIDDGGRVVGRPCLSHLFQGRFDFGGGGPVVEDPVDRLGRPADDDRVGYIGLVMVRCRKREESEGYY
jgi:hypothetical protein